MNAIKNLEYEDCPKRCRKPEHGRLITSALTKPTISDQKLAAYVAKACRNFPVVVDAAGRSGLHIACTAGRYAIAEWLLNHGADVNLRDLDSGRGPLHRAICSGSIDIAVMLMRYEANWELEDDAWCVPSQYICQYKDYRISRLLNDNELLVWGLNKNYNIGIGDTQVRQTPQFIDYFRKNNISIVKVAISSFHSLFLDDHNQLYVVGHGQGGRLGIDAEISLATPSRVRIKLKIPHDRVIDISCSKNHSMLLTSCSSVYVCGLNTDLQLGLRPIPKMTTTFKEVCTMRDYREGSLTKVIAQDSYSIVHSQSVIYFWGANNGQFGGNETNESIPNPKPMFLPDGAQIKLLTTSPAAIAVYSKSVLLYYNYKMRAIKPPVMEDLKCISLSGGDSAKSSRGSIAGLKLLMLTESNSIYVWYDISQHFLRCTLSRMEFNEIDKILYKANHVLLLSQGYAYHGKCTQVYSTQQVVENDADRWLSNSRQETCMDYKINISLTRIPTLDRVVDIFADEDLNSFAAVQEGSCKYLRLPQLKFPPYSFESLLTDANEFDSIHDIVFHVQYQTFCAHKLIVFWRAQGLRLIVEQNSQKDVHLNVANLTPTIFAFIMRYIYANYLPTFDDLHVLFEQSGTNTIQENCTILISIGKEFELTDLVEYLERVTASTLTSTTNKFLFSKIKRSELPDLYDVVIKCDEDKEIPAHKCVLISMEYFNSMFAHSWSEQSTIHLTTVPYDHILLIVDFLYTEDVEFLRRQKYPETFLYNMIVTCDQFLFTKLKEVFESLLVEKITIKKCADFLEFACLYNCTVLKDVTLEFICQNMERVISQSVLAGCDHKLLTLVNSAYRKMFEINDFSTVVHQAVSDEALLNFVDGFEVDLDYRAENDQDYDKTKHKSKAKEIRSRLAREYEQEAILTMKELSVESKLEYVKKLEDFDLLDEAKDVASKIQSEVESWMKIVAKKELKKKTPVKAIDTILSEEKSKVDIVAPTTSNSNVVSMESDENSPTAAKAGNLSLADFGLQKSEKMSQKQKKRYSSESARVDVPTTPSNSVPASPSAWGICQPANSYEEENDLTMSSPQKSQNSPGPSYANPSTSSSSFAQIQAEAQQQKSYYERMRTKSLALTQIEETAISELKQFYNVENASDEVITIERKPLPSMSTSSISNMDCPAWKRN